MSVIMNSALLGVALLNLSSQDSGKIVIRSADDIALEVPSYSALVKVPNNELYNKVSLQDFDHETLISVHSPIYGNSSYVLRIEGLSDFGSYPVQFYQSYRDEYGLVISLPVGEVKFCGSLEVRSIVKIELTRDGSSAWRESFNGTCEVESGMLSASEFFAKDIRVSN